MIKFFSLIKFFINILLYCIYTFLFVILGNFLYWAYLFYVLETNVPWPEDIIHIKLAVFIAVVVLIITTIFRSFFYLKLFKKNK